MSQVIDVPGQGPVEFPDDMNDEQIVAAIKRTQLQAPNAEQRRMGIRQPRVKDERFAQNVGHAVESAPYDIGGVVTDLGAKMRLPPEISAGAGYIANVATDTVPNFIGGAVAKAPVAMDKAQNIGRWLMQQALKPNAWERRTGKAAQAIETMLQEGYNATKGGVAAMKDKIGELNTAVEQALANSTARIDKHAVADRLRTLLDDFTKQVTPNADSAAIQKAWTEFLQHPLVAGRDMSVQLAQELKQGTYKALGKKSYGELKGADVEAQKALARGLKEEISAAVPQVAPLNAKESALINAANVAERRTMLQDNNNLGGLVWLAHDPIAALGFMADKSALVKSILARGMYSGAIPGSFGQLGGGIGAIIGAQGQE